MWPRLSELAIAAWLMASAFLIPVPGATDTTMVPLVGGALVVATFVASRRWRHAHLAILLIAAGLIAWGWARFPRPGPAAAQSAMLAGLMLGLLGVVPNEAMDPPVAWRRHVQDPD